MKPATALVALTCAWAARAEPPTEVLVLKRAGVTAYEEVSEEFAERCRVRARVVSFGDEGVSALRGRGGKHELIVTVGQEALDAVLGKAEHVIPTLAFHTPAGLLGPPAAPPPELLLRVLVQARRTIKTIGVVYGPRSEPLVTEAKRAAERMGLVLDALRVESGPKAVRALATLAGRVQALWLPGDTDVVSPQVFQYLIRLQLERGIPVAAATRQQVHGGALVAVDFDPRAAGRAAANIANRILEGKTVTDPGDVDLYGGARITVNQKSARRLGIDVEALAKMGAKVH